MTATMVQPATLPETERSPRESALRVVLDTDIGDDVDDCLALSLVLASPELQLDGVTCVHGDVELRARIVLKLLQLHGDHRGVPVLGGATQPLLRPGPVKPKGHAGVGLLEPEDEKLRPGEQHAVDFLIQTVLDNPGQIHLVATGPLTNIAMAFQREPSLAERLAHLTIMGGAIRGTTELHLPYTEHNVRCDPEAAHIVLSAGAPITLVPLDVTRKVQITMVAAERIRAGGTAFHDAVARQIELYPVLPARGYTWLHDPLAVGTLLRPDLVQTHPLHIDVELSGKHTTGATFAREPTENAPANADVALDVDISAFEEFFLNRLAQPPPDHHLHDEGEGK